MAMIKQLSELNAHTLVLTLGAYFLFRFVLLSLSLWFMLKTQDLNYTVPGLLGSAALASLFDMIPLVGHYAAVAVLLLCVLKLTQAALFDVRFTVAISYAVMFLLQMVVFSLLPGSLPVHARTPSLVETAQQTLTEDADPDEPGTNEITALVSRPEPSPETNMIPKTVAAVQNPPSPPPVKPVATNAAPGTIPATTAAVAPAKPPIEAVKKFKLKGVVDRGADSSATIDAGTKTFTLQIGESRTVTTADGDIEFSFIQLTDRGAILRSGNQTTLLRLQ